MLKVLSVKEGLTTREKGKRQDHTTIAVEWQLLIT